MDPFLEAPAFFGGLHNTLITYIEDALQRSLPEPYYAATGDRVWIDVDRRYVEPDTNVLRSETVRGEQLVALAALPAVTAPVVVNVPHDEHREPYVEILTRLGDEERLVTTIEVLSPANKTSGEQGRELYLRKQREVLSGKIHLVEIDLLRGGRHMTAVPLKLACAKAGPFDYHVCVHRFDNLEDYFVYPIQLPQALPVIEVPLLPDDPPVRLDLQAVFNRAYDTGPYRRRVRYTAPVPPPSLTDSQAAWVRQTLRDKGLLPAAEPA
jgi:hypothetical protein